MEQKFTQKKAAGSADITGAANTDVIMFTATTASKVNALPQGFAGEFVRIQPIGTDMYYYFVVTPTTAAPSNTIALPPAATDVGAQAGYPGRVRQVGFAILEVMVPYCPIAGAVWFCRWGVTAAQSVQITKTSGAPGGNTAR
jgi:hypothetical protein